ncbi:MAG: DNA-binding protein [Chloroflexi bacterium]|nr:DNA-binding protein [Chloroflexota bacterium]
MAQPTNAAIADLLEHIAELLEGQDANPFRIRAYRDGARTIRDTDSAIADYVRQDQLDALKALPNIGEGITAVIREFVTTGESDLVRDLEAQTSPAAVFTRVPGIGQELARRIAEQLDVETLAELEEAAHDGRLASIEGFGKRRVEGIRNALAGMLSRSAQRQQRERTSEPAPPPVDRSDRPSVALLLAVDADYRQRAEAGNLQKIAPRRFNPQNEAWLPILHDERDGYHFTALFSNTAQAHDLGRTDDWVVIYYERDGRERQNTVVTETKGELKGQRIVRGREPETQQYYQKTGA